MKHLHTYIFMLLVTLMAATTCQAVNYYNVLGVEEDVDLAQLRQARNSLLSNLREKISKNDDGSYILDADAVLTLQRIREVQKAYWVLSVKNRRADIDRRLKFSKKEYIPFTEIDALEDVGDDLEANTYFSTEVKEAIKVLQNEESGKGPKSILFVFSRMSSTIKQPQQIAQIIANKTDAQFVGIEFTDANKTLHGLRFNINEEPLQVGWDKMGEQFASMRDMGDVVFFVKNLVPKKAQGARKGAMLRLLVELKDPKNKNITVIAATQGGGTITPLTKETQRYITPDGKKKTQLMYDLADVFHLVASKNKLVFSFDDDGTLQRMVEASTQAIEKAKTPKPARIAKRHVQKLTHYELLEIEPTAGIREIREAYYKMRPQMKTVQEKKDLGVAFSTLNNRVARRKYDQRLARQAKREGKPYVELEANKRNVKRKPATARARRTRTRYSRSRRR